MHDAQEQTERSRASATQEVFGAARRAPRAAETALDPVRWSCDIPFLGLPRMLTLNERVARWTRMRIVAAENP